MFDLRGRVAPECIETPQVRPDAAGYKAIRRSQSYLVV